MFFLSFFDNHVENVGKIAIFVYMAKEVKEFLHKINIDKLKNELQKDVPSIADLVEIGENGVYKWAWNKSDNGARPSYNALIQLLRAGATVETLFGVSYKPKQFTALAPLPEFIKAHPELLEGLREQLMEDFREKGIFSEDEVRDIVRQEICRLNPDKNDDKI